MSDIGALLIEANLHPTLVDVGSSGYRHKIWDPISKHARIIGFDPDNRHFDPEFERVFHDAILINKAVTDNDEDDEVEFVLTRYPSCSSILEGDIEALEPFMFRDYFVEERRVQSPATSLNRTIENLDTPRIDWLKIDAQGFDLALVKSLSADNLANISAIDIEPGFINAYKGEHLFPDVHQYMLANGFWLSDLPFQAYPRSTPASWSKMVDRAGKMGVDERFLIRHLKGAPTAAEARYLRDLTWLEHNHKDNLEMFVLTFIFATLDDHIAFAFDVTQRTIDLFGTSQLTEHMCAITDKEFEATIRQHR